MLRTLILILILITAGFAFGCGPRPSALDQLLVSGRYDEAITEGEKMLKEKSDDYGVMIVIGDAYFFKAQKINQDRGMPYTPEGAALARKAIDYYKKSMAINRSQRVEQKISNTGTLMSPP